MLKHIELINNWGKTLRGYLNYPDNFNGEMIVMFHGFTGNKTEHANHFKNISRLFSENGYASLRMDFSGNGESDGEFYNFTFDTMMSEAKQFIEFAFNYEKVLKVSVLGYSMGGAVASMISAIYGNKLSKIILWSAAPNILEHIKKRYDNQKNDDSLLTHDTFQLSKEMYDSVDNYDTMKGIEVFTNPVLIIHGHNDATIDYLYAMRYSVRYYNAIVHIIDGAGHGYDKHVERDELYNKTLEFLAYCNNK